MNVPTINPKDFIKPSWTEEEKANARLVIDFAQNIMNNHDFDYILQKYGHSPG